jgi:hypothetical protein
MFKIYLEPVDIKWSGDSAGWYSEGIKNILTPPTLIPYTSAYYQESDIGSELLRRTRHQIRP